MKNIKLFWLLISIMISPVYAQIEIANQLDVQVKKAKSVVTTNTTTSIQVISEDGTNIGTPSKKESEPVIKEGQEVGIVFVKVGRPWEQVAIKVRSTTADFINPLPGVYATTSPGTHSVNVSVLSVVPPILWDDVTVTVVVGTGPNPPPTPEPGPTPTPPRPDGAPIEGEGFRVLFIAETGEEMTKDIQEAFYSPDVLSFLNSVCIKVNDTPDFRRVDPDTQFTDPNHRFAKALARPRTSLPWIIISNGTTGYEGPFPGGKSATLELIRSFVPLQSSTPITVTKKPLVVMYSLPTCVPCKQWKLVELPQMVGIDFKMEPPVSGVTKVPTFDIYFNDKSTRLVGYQTAQVILDIIKGMK